MPNYIAIDGGTTNTRVRLVCNYKICDTEKQNIGARQGSDDPAAYKNAIRDSIALILKRNDLREGDITAILASGMITSEGGLINLPHLAAPCGIRALSAGLYKTEIPEISSIPFTFIRGVKTGGVDFADTDMMRGEETELMGLLDGLLPDTLYVLPGSHSKLVETDGEGRISTFSTQLTGELLSAVARGTILQNSVDLTESETDTDYLKRGYLFAKEKGVNAAFFKVRVLDKLFGCTKKQAYSFFMGAVLSPEIENIINAAAENVIIGGKAVLKAPTATLLRAFSHKNVTEIGEVEAENATALGAVRIFEYGSGK
ncbi:MAG: 2-dehydro-3-deoxygalactonokinase [Clostridia bacterium]|nr:2-dehydro-3-deoxygalactonokinase [Clostridia bacterium]